MYSNMNSRDHVEPALRALSQCCRSERCRVHILARNYPPYVVQLCRRHASSWSVCQSAIRILNWLSTDLARLEVVCRSKAVELSLSILRKHAANRPVVGAAAAFLARAGGLRPAALQVILARSAVPDVVSAIRLVHDDAGVQRELVSAVYIPLLFPLLDMRYVCCSYGFCRCYRALPTALSSWIRCAAAGR